MHTVTAQMADEYERIQKRAGEDPGTAGDQGEENWKGLFEEWLPPTYQVVTKGRILSHKGTAGPQVDVLVLHPTYPKGLLDKKVYFAGGIAAAFECKVTLKAEHINSAMRNSVAIRRLIPIRTGSPYKELCSPLIYGLLAHSHIWKALGSKPLKNIEDNLRLADLQHVNHPTHDLSRPGRRQYSQACGLLSPLRFSTGRRGERPTLGCNDLLRRDSRKSLWWKSCG
jgi:Domain of unknown function (DUF6602)